MVAAAIKIDNRICERDRERKKTAVSSSGTRGFSTADHPVRRTSFGSSPASEATAFPIDSEEPMQLGRARISPEERRHRLVEARCFYCGQQGHQQAMCPVKEQARR
ncbi:hypothetical protein CgunFtcFv8_003500 [Champsocephalus gunnari]|uniref:CCHC-type domain-containing protein n=1 Tax=Champsocephalus gunnari TaxID=52237 RepID=A0AAN8DEI7_CHAGU|nr:hypothetical protein CgunFtcFv8_003500 [Champsocephalus gunnari]